MRVAIVLNSSWNIVNFRMGLLRILEASGHEIVAIAPRDGFVDKIPFEYHELRMNARGMNPLKELLLLRGMLRVLRVARPDVILTFTPKPNIYGAMAARILGIPVVANVAGLGTMFTAGSASRILMEGLYRLAFRRASHVFFQNEDDRAYFTRKGITRDLQGSRIYGSGVDLARFAPEPFPQNSPPVFLLVSRLLWEKGIGDFVEAARLLRAGGTRAHFRIAGIFDEGNVKAVSRSQMDAWAEEGIVEFLGALEDVRAAISAADALVLPSTYREGVPRVLIEGAALGRPLVAYENVGVGDIVVSGRNGILVPTRDVHGLADALARLANAPVGERAAMGAESRRIAEERFDEKNIAREYLDVIGKLRQQ